MVAKKEKLKFLERVKEEEIKAREKKERLIEQIQNERAKKKEEIEKPLEFNLRTSKVDKKFQKVYDEMMRKEQENKNKFNIFAQIVQDFQMKECNFHPNLKKDSDGERNRKKLNSCEMIQRLYDDEIKTRCQKKEDLRKKYKPTFRPKINQNTNELVKRWKVRNENKIKEKRKEANNDDINKDKKKGNKSPKRKKYKNKSQEKIRSGNNKTKKENKSITNNENNEEKKDAENNNEENVNNESNENKEIKENENGNEEKENNTENENKEGI